MLLLCRPIYYGCPFIGDSLRPRRMCVRVETQKTPRRRELAGGATGSERVSYSHVVWSRSRCCAAVVSCCRIGHQFVETRHFAGFLSNRAHYCRTCGVGQHCQSATSHSWLHFDGINKLLWCYTWLLLHNLATSLYWILPTVWSLVLCFLCKMADVKTFVVSRTVTSTIRLLPFSTSVDNKLQCSPVSWSITVNGHWYVPALPLGHMCLSALWSPRLQV